jgi:hypothetical protein
VYALVVKEGCVYAGGAFSSAGGIAATNIAKWDGTTWSALGNGVRYSNSGGSENGAVRSVAIAQGDLYVGGSFKLAGSQGATNIAKWDGSNWSSLGRGASGTVQALVANGHELFAGGGFVLMDGISVHATARWDGTNWWGLGSGFFHYGPVAAACNGSEVFFAGGFWLAGNKPSTNIALWHIPYTLNVSLSGNTVALSWPAAGTNFVLDSTTSLAASAWAEVPQSPVAVGDQCVVTNSIVAPSQFVRLRRR